MAALRPRPRVGQGGEHWSPSPAAASWGTTGTTGSTRTASQARAARRKPKPRRVQLKPPEVGVSGEAQAPGMPPQGQHSLGTFTEGCRWTGSSGEPRGRATEVPSALPVAAGQRGGIGKGHPTSARRQPTPAPAELADAAISLTALQLLPLNGPHQLLDKLHL